MPNFTGQLRSNEIFAGLFNMIISQQTFADNIYDTKSSLVNMSRVDGGMYGDTKLYYSTDALKSYPWNNDAEAANLLALERPPSPECQAVVIDVFRQIRLTVDYYLSKRAWSDESSFSEFNSVMIGWIRDTKRVYDSTHFNAFVGTNETTVGKQSITITVPTGDQTDFTQKEAFNRILAQTIAERMANLMVDLEDVTRDYNDYGQLRSYSGDSLIAVWNSEYANMITRMDLPTIFHNDKATPDKFAEYTLPARYFGVVNTNGGQTIAQNQTIRALVELEFNAVPINDPAYDKRKHCFPGDVLPGNVNYNANETYTEDGTIIFKIMHKKSVPFMSSFEAATSFFNPRSLTDTKFLTWSRNTMEHLKGRPFITVRASEAVNDE